jgi:hypothetical protein
VTGPRPPLRTARAVVLACVATAVGAASHVLSGGTLTGAGVAATLPVLALLAWPLTGRERGWWPIAGVQLAGQHAAHALFALGVARHDVASHHAAGHPNSVLPVDAWFYGHLLAAVAVATWLRHAERRTWAAARRAAAALSAHWYRLWTRLPDRPDTGGSPAVTPALAPPGTLRCRPLRHSVIRRGPPAPA